MSALRDALLEAHVQHELERWRERMLELRVDGWARGLFLWARAVKLDDVVSSEHVMAVIRRYVIELRVSGGIVELAGEMSRLVLDSPSNAETKLNELLGDEAYEAFAEKVSRLEGVWRELLARIARSEAAELIHARLLARSFGDLLLARSGPLLQRFKAGFEARVAGVVARRLGAARDETAARREKRLREVMDAELVRSAVDELWTSLAALPLSELLPLISDQDLEDFVVLGYEFWLRYRQSPYFERIMRELVDHFFRKYGPQSLAALIEDMGVEEAMVARELRELLAPAVAHELRMGFVEQLVRAQLEPFYRSERCLTLLPAPT